jgi:hypothetical protein
MAKTDNQRRPAHRKGQREIKAAHPGNGTAAEET